MTIHHPRVGLETTSATPAGSDREGATEVPISVGATFILLAGASGGIVLSGPSTGGPSAGDRVSIRPANGFTQRLYLPSGETLAGTAVADFALSVEHVGDLVRLLKISPSEWIVDRP